MPGTVLRAVTTLAIVFPAAASAQALGERIDSLVNTHPIANINDLLTARTPGLQVMSSGATGC